MSNILFKEILRETGITRDQGMQYLKGYSVEAAKLPYAAVPHYSTEALGNWIYDLFSHIKLGNYDPVKLPTQAEVGAILNRSGGYAAYKNQEISVMPGIKGDFLLYIHALLNASEHFLSLDERLTKLTRFLASLLNDPERAGAQVGLPGWRELNQHLITDAELKHLRSFFTGKSGESTQIVSKVYQRQTDLEVAVANVSTLNDRLKGVDINALNAKADRLAQISQGLKSVDLSRYSGVSASQLTQLLHDYAVTLEAVALVTNQAGQLTNLLNTQLQELAGFASMEAQIVEFEKLIKLTQLTLEAEEVKEAAKDSMVKRALEAAKKLWERFVAFIKGLFIRAKKKSDPDDFKATADKAEEAAKEASQYPDFSPKAIRDDVERTRIEHAIKDHVQIGAGDKEIDLHKLLAYSKDADMFEEITKVIADVKKLIESDGELIEVQQVYEKFLKTFRSKYPEMTDGKDEFKSHLISKMTRPISFYPPSEISGIMKDLKTHGEEVNRKLDRVLTTLESKLNVSQADYEKDGKINAQIPDRVRGFQVILIQLLQVVQNAQSCNDLAHSTCKGYLPLYAQIEAALSKQNDKNVDEDKHPNPNKKD